MSVIMIITDPKGISKERPFPPTEAGADICAKRHFRMHFRKSEHLPPGTRPRFMSVQSGLQMIQPHQNITVRVSHDHAVILID